MFENLVIMVATDLFLEFFPIFLRVYNGFKESWKICKNFLRVHSGSELSQGELENL